MEFIEEIFVGESVKDLSTIIYSLKRGIPVFNLYCICLFSRENNPFEILTSRELFLPRNKEKNYLIAGIATGKREATDLFLYMVEHAAAAGRDVAKPEELIK